MDEPRNGVLTGGQSGTAKHGNFAMNRSVNGKTNWRGKQVDKNQKLAGEPVTRNLRTSLSNQ